LSRTIRSHVKRTGRSACPTKTWRANGPLASMAMLSRAGGRFGSRFRGRRRRTNARRLDGAAQDETWRRRAYQVCCGMKNRRMNAQVQRMRKINAAFRLETALRIVQDEIRHLDSAATNVEISLRGREPARRGILSVPGNQARKIHSAEFHIPRVQSAIAFHGTNQIRAAHAMSGERERSGCCSGDTVAERRHGAN